MKSLFTSLLALALYAVAAHAAPHRPSPPPSSGAPASVPASPAPSPAGQAAPSGGNPTTTAGAGASALDALVPQFGVIPGTRLAGVQPGSCSGSNGVAIPCFCPPARPAFLEKLAEAVAAGNVFGTRITFSTDAADQSAATNRLRATACVIVLQNFNGTAPGVGCPAASAPNFLSQQKTGVRSDAVLVPPPS